MATASPPTREIGVTNSFSSPQLPGWRSFGGVVDEIEKVPDLRWPRSVRQTYPAMRNDSQIEALFYATTLPIRRYTWMLDPNGAREEAVVKLAADLGLPIKGEDAGPVRRAKGRFSFGEHLRLVLQALLSGHYIFEQYGVIGDDRLWHLRKLAPRAPFTIEEWGVESDGGLRDIRQTFGQNSIQPPPIPIDNLVAYVWDQEPGQWIGRSMLRSIYREWTLKDRLIRVDTVKHDRNGLGIPTAKATDKDVTPQQLAAAQTIAAAWRAGEHASASLPFGTDIELKGVQGNLPDTLASIERHDQAMSKRWLGMLLDLAQTPNGSRALGETHADLIELGRDAIAGWVCDVFSEHVLEDDVDWNFGEQEEFCPRLTYERDPGPQPVAAPPADPAVPAPPAAPTARRRRPVRAAAGNLPDRPLRRDPNAQEIQAKIDFQAVDELWQSARDALVVEINALQVDQIAELHNLIVAADGDLSALAAIQATPVAEQALTARMAAVLEEGARQAMAEAAAQGTTIAMPDLEAAQEQLAARAAAIDTLLARSLSEAAGRQALQRTGQALAATEVADQVASYLGNLTDAYLEDQLGGAISQAQLSGRKLIMQTATPERIYASALLDANACEPCLDEDGTEYDSLEEAEQQFPTGGNADCEGGPRCRCSLVAVWGEQEPSA